MTSVFARIISIILIISMCVPFVALADEYDLAQGDVIVTGGEGGQTVTQAAANIVNNPDPAPVVTQSTPTTSNTITVNGDAGSVSVTIDNVNIDTGSNEPAISTSGDATIIVEGDNTVKSEGTAIEATGNLTIKSTAVESNTNPSDESVDDTSKDDNSLTADGGKTGIDVDAPNASDGELIITSNATVNANGGTVGVDANVTVNGGNLNAYGDVYGTGTEAGVGIDGNLTVTDGAAAVYGDDVGVKGDVTVGTGDTGTPIAPADDYVIVHSPGTKVSGKTIVKDTGKLTEKSSSYVPVSSGTMFFGRTGCNFDIQGRFKDIETPLKTTYANYGYYTYVRTDDAIAQVDLRSTGAEGNTGLKIDIQLVPKKNGQLLQIVYTVTNVSEKNVIFDLGTGADVQIGSADNAVIAPIPGDTGFIMSNQQESSSDYGASFAFFGKGYVGVTDVDQFWHGPYSSNYDDEYYWSGNKSDAVFFENKNSVDGTFDSAASWCWLDEEIAAGKTMTYTVLLGVGDAEELKDAAGDNVLVPDDAESDDNSGTEPMPKPVPPSTESPAEDAPAPKPAKKQPNMLDIKLDRDEETIDLIKGTQGGKPMEKIEAKVEILSGNDVPKGTAIVVHEVKTTADSTVEDLPKENIGMAFTVSCIHDGVVTGLPGKVQLIIPVHEGNLDEFKLVFVGENGKLKNVEFEIIDGEIVFIAKWVGLYMMVRE